VEGATIAWRRIGSLEEIGILIHAKALSHASSPFVQMEVRFKIQGIVLRCSELRSEWVGRFQYTNPRLAPVITTIGPSSFALL
jgi:hypothetical protein